MNTLKRLTPALVLLILSPLIAEFLLGDFNIQQIAYLGIFIPLYGASALFIREIVRRSKRGWISLILLGVVFGLIAEGLVNLTLFNPHYAGATLLKYGFISELGTSFNYAIFIVTLHTVWSMSVPIAIAEGLSGNRSNSPWLHTPELLVVGLLSILGLVGTAVSTIKRFDFVASALQYSSIIALIFVVVFVAFKVIQPHPNNADKRNGHGPNIWLVLIVAFFLSSAFQLWFHFAPQHHINAIAGVLVFIAINVLALVIFSIWAKQSGWKSTHIVAAATGAVLTYGWFGLHRLIVSGHTAMGVPTKTIDVVGQVALLIAVIAVCFWAFKKSSQKHVE